MSFAETKICTGCGLEKPLTEFRRDNRPGRTGYKSRCKSCTAERGSGTAMIQQTAMLRYDAARSAIAECKSYDEVREWGDKAAALKEYARRAGDRTMIADCEEIRIRAARRQGELIAEMRATGTIREGAGDKTVTGAQRITLADVGIDRRESMRCQQIAAIKPDEFEGLLSRGRARLETDDKRHVIDVLRERDGLVNGARAIMGSRKEPDDSLDFFPTPPWATRALMQVFTHLSYQPTQPDQWSVWEPACGEGHMAEVLREYFGEVCATDIRCYGYKDGCFDFITHAPDVAYDWIITNPPFGDRTEAFVLRALDLARIGVAMFVRLQWLESVGRYESIFRDHPPTVIAFFAERVNLCKGRWDPDGTTATAYIWLVWIRDRVPHSPIWIPPGQREKLTKPDDRERFTAHPVIAKGVMSYNTVAERSHEPANTTQPASEADAPVQARASREFGTNTGLSKEPVLLVPSHRNGEGESVSDPGLGAGSPFLGSHDSGPIPDFLRR